MNKFNSWKISNVLSNLTVFSFVTIFIITIFFVYHNKTSNSVASVTHVDSKNINKLIDSGKVVFVDITAEWCITCKVNKYFVLEKDDVKRKLEEEVVYIEVDWTRRDLEVLKYINSFNRSGIPLNIVYGKVAPNGIVLPEILSQEVLFRSIDIAKGSKNLAEK